MGLDRRLSRACGPALIIGSVLYFFFYGLPIAGGGLGDQFWMLTLSLHGFSIIAITIGLIGCHAALHLDGWQTKVWWLSTAMAFLGLTVANAFFGVAVLGVAAIAVGLRSAPIGAMLGIGGFLWIYLYVLGVRVGDQNARVATSSEEVLGLLAVGLMSLGLIGMGSLAARQVRRSGEQPEEV